MECQPAGVLCVEGANVALEETLILFVHVSVMLPYSLLPIGCKVALEALVVLLSIVYRPHVAVQVRFAGVEPFADGTLEVIHIVDVLVSMHVLNVAPEVEAPLELPLAYGALVVPDLQVDLLDVLPEVSLPGKRTITVVAGVWPDLLVYGPDVFSELLVGRERFGTAFALLLLQVDHAHVLPGALLGFELELTEEAIALFGSLTIVFVRYLWRPIPVFVL